MTAKEQIDSLGYTFAEWQEYDRICEDMARRGLTGKIGDPLPNLISKNMHDFIQYDPESFQERIRAHAYRQAMEKANLPAE